MAWNTHWQIDFMSFLGTSYSLKIQDETYAGDPIALTGAANPFETQEDDADNIFTPIRVQTGYFRVVTSDATLLETMIPEHALHRRVELWAGNTLQWRGFMTPKSFSQPNLDHTFTLSFPVVSTLGVLQSVDFNLFYGEMHTLAEFIQEAFSLIGIEIDTDALIYVQTELADITDILKLKLSGTLFTGQETLVNDNTPVTNITYSSCSAVLSALLQPFGLCLRESMGNYYIMSSAYKNAISVVTKYLLTLSTVTLSNSSTTGFSAIPTTGIASADGEESVNAGAREVKVSLDVNKEGVIDTGEPETPYSTNTIYGGTVIRDGESDGVLYMQPVDYPSEQRRQLWTERMYMYYQSVMVNRSTSEVESFTNTVITELARLALSSAFDTDTLGHITDTPDRFGEGGAIGACLCRHDKAESVKDLLLSPGLLVNMNNAYRKAVYYSSSTVYAGDLIYILVSNKRYTLKSGYLHLDIEYKGLEYYARGYQSSLGGPHFCVMIGSTVVMDNTTVYHITSEISGEISVRIYAGDDYPFPNKPRTAIITRLRLYLSVNENEVTASRDSSNNYKLFIDRQFTAKNAINLSVGTNNHNVASMSMLQDGDNQTIEEVGIVSGSTTENIRPELYLVNLMKNQYQDVQRTIKRTFRIAPSSVSPMSVFTQDDHHFVAVANTVRWRDDIVKMKYIQTAITE